MPNLRICGLGIENYTSVTSESMFEVTVIVFIKLPKLEFPDSGYML